MGDQFDAVMNYEFSILVWNYFMTEQAENKAYTAKQFQFAVGKLLTSYPKHVTQNLFNLLESHDTERMLSRVAGNLDMAKLAYIFLLTFPGTPCIYYGGEIGMDGGKHSNRQCMIWEEEKQETEWFLLIKQRR
jgi:glycosidase